MARIKNLSWSQLERRVTKANSRYVAEFWGLTIKSRDMASLKWLMSIYKNEVSPSRPRRPFRLY